MPIREVEECSYERLILLQKNGFVYFGISGKAPDVIFDSLVRIRCHTGQPPFDLLERT
jgi:hypothetical protein